MFEKFMQEVEAWLKIDFSTMNEIEVGRYKLKLEKFFEELNVTYKEFKEQKERNFLEVAETLNEYYGSTKEEVEVLTKIAAAGMISKEILEDYERFTFIQENIPLIIEEFNKILVEVTNSIDPVEILKQEKNKIEGEEILVEAVPEGKEAKQKPNGIFSLGIYSRYLARRTPPYLRQ